MHRVGKIHTPRVNVSSSEQDDERPIVLFVCAHNAGKSRMAEALLDRLAGDRYLARSAGTQPAPRPNPEVVEAMREEGLDLEDRPGTQLTQEMADSAIKVVSMGCDIGDALGASTVEVEDWAFENPTGKSPDEVAALRDEIEMKVRNLVARLDRETAAD